MSEQMSEEGRVVPINWYFPENIVSRYATNLLVQHSEHEFIISFFETRPPVLLGPPEEVKARLDQIDSVRAECVARIIIAAERMPEFVQVLRDNLERYLSRKEME